MDLDTRQTRNLLLAATAPVPMPYPKSGVIAIFEGNLTYGQGQQVLERLLIVVDHCHDATIVHNVLRKDVSAVYIDGAWDENDEFQISDEPWVDNFERGEWFLLEDIDDAIIRQRLGLQGGDDITSRDSILRGIAFVLEGKPLLQTTEVALIAGEFGGGGYPCCRTCCRTCYKTCCKH